LFQEFGAGDPYVLHCYDNDSMVYNTASPAAITSACVLTEPGEQKVLMGLILTRDAPSDINNTINNIVGTYGEQFPDINVYYYEECTATDSELEGDSNFSTCVQADNPGLYIYYETNYRYLVVSNEQVLGIDRPTVWQRITGWFSNLFDTSRLNTAAYTSLDYTTSYDRIYLLRDAGLSVTAIEEYKYDEALMKPVTVLYVRYEGSSNDTNPINSGQLFKAVNKTLRRNSLLNMTYQSDPQGQELIIQTDNKTSVWRYFTSMLRVRTPSGDPDEGISTGIQESTGTNENSNTVNGPVISGTSDVLSDLNNQGTGTSGTGSVTGGGTVDISATGTCYDDIQNNGEVAGVDCGGPCLECLGDLIEPGAMDSSTVDTSAPGTCTDGIQNNGEVAGVDCGGPCTACFDELVEPVSMDPGTCTDGIQNNGETIDVDCGGPCTACFNELTEPAPMTTGTTTTTTTTTTTNPTTTTTTTTNPTTSTTLVGPGALPPPPRS